MSDLKSKIVTLINELKEEEATARKNGNVEMCSGISLARVMLEETYRESHGSIPLTMNGEVSKAD